MDNEALKHRARSRFERGRAVDALWASMLLWPVLALAVWAAPVVDTALWAVGVTWLAAWGALWRGGELAAGVMPGVMCAIFPLVGAHCASHIGHMCTGDGCYSLCAPLCGVGGLVAGLVLARRMIKIGGRWTGWLTGGFIVLAMGATGCTCIGLGGVAGVTLGLALGATPLIWVQPSRTTS
ncbi:MAG: hypothetical protein ACE366_12525 [Bradymonadia bacterium]